MIQIGEEDKIMTKNARKIVKRVGVVLALGFAMLALSIVPAVGTVAEAQASTGYPMYSWGINATGQLGLGNQVNQSTPQRVGTASNWVWTTIAGGGSFAINSEGHLYGWGNTWNSFMMGQGANPSPGTGYITEPTRIGTANNWVMVSAMGGLTTVAALNSDGEIYQWGVQGLAGSPPIHAANTPTRLGTASDWVYISTGLQRVMAINEQGELWAIGSNGTGQLGDGTTEDRTDFVRIGDRSDWKLVNTSFSAAIALTESGELFTWGNNTQGQLGLGNTMSPVLIPTRVGTESNWVTARMLGHNTVNNGAGIAINSDGELFSWGHPSNRQLGNGETSGNVLTPTQIGTESNWVSVHGGNNYAMAFNELGELWSWGNNHAGQLGLGDLSNRSVPERVLRSYGFSAAARGSGFSALMLMRTTPAAGEGFLQKHLQKPEGTPIPNLTFEFTFERNSYNDNSTRPDLNTILPAIGPVTITIDSTSNTNTAGGIATTTQATNLLEGIEFARAGVFSYIVRETVNSSGATAPSNVVYSQAVYELRVYVVGDGSTIGGTFEVDTINVLRRIDCQGNIVTPPQKVDDFSFTNQYTRTTTGTQEHVGALRVSKNIVGDFIDINNLSFDFDVTLTRTALCPTNTTFSGRILNQAGTQVGSPITFPSGTSVHVELGHGQRLVFDELVVGTTFTVTERAAQEFRASVLLYADGTQVTIAPNEDPNTALPIGNHLIGVARNTADFTDTHTLGAPTGLSISSNIPLIVPAAMVITLVAYIAARRRKSIEDLSLITQ